MTFESILLRVRQALAPAGIRRFIVPSTDVKGLTRCHR